MHIEISAKLQQLKLIDDMKTLKSYLISTAKNGLGEKLNSEKTPRGEHEVIEKIGTGELENTVFLGRKPTGEIYSQKLSDQHPGRDWILTRIMWLSGLEIGKNLGGDVDTKSRYIYIHGCPDKLITGVADSHGCIRMRNSDIVELFELVPVGTKVLIGQ